MGRASDRAEHFRVAVLGSNEITSFTCRAIFDTAQCTPTSARSPSCGFIVVTVSFAAFLWAELLFIFLRFYRNGVDLDIASNTAIAPLSATFCFHVSGLFLNFLEFPVFGTFNRFATSIVSSIRQRKKWIENFVSCISRNSTKFLKVAKSCRKLQITMATNFFIMEISLCQVIVVIIVYGRHSCNSARHMY